jgi:hypothetical protein
MIRLLRIMVDTLGLILLVHVHAADLPARRASAPRYGRAGRAAQA